MTPTQDQTEIGGAPAPPLPRWAWAFGAAWVAALGASFAGVGDPTGFRVAAVIFLAVFLQSVWLWRRGVGPGSGSVRFIQDEADLEALLREERALLFKHSTTCPISARALVELHDFVRSEPGLPVYQLQVLENRALSDEIAHRLQVRHHSPQLILVTHGEAEDTLSHGAIRRRSIERFLGGEP